LCGIGGHDQAAAVANRANVPWIIVAGVFECVYCCFAAAQPALDPVPALYSDFAQNNV
jgi:hypothetical protein